MTAAVRHVARMDRRLHLLVLAVLSLVTLGMLTGIAGQVADVLSGDREHIRASLAGLGVAAPFASIALNVVQGVVAPIPGFVVPFINGMVFGTWAGMFITWIGGIAAASACFGISRTFGRGLAERLCVRYSAMERANDTLERHGLSAIIVARSLPGMPFDAFSYLGGLSRVSYRRFALGTAIGSAPHALAYSLMGSHLSVPLWMGLALTPVIGLAVAGAHWAVSRLRRGAAARRTTPVAETASRPVPAAPARRGCADRLPVTAPSCRPRRGARGIDAWRVEERSPVAAHALGH